MVRLEDREVGQCKEQSGSGWGRGEDGQVKDTQGRTGGQRGWTGKGQSGSGWRTERLDR